MKEEKKYTRRQWLAALGAAVGGAAAIKATGASTPAQATPAPLTRPAGKVSRIAAGQLVSCNECDRCMPCGYGVDIPGNLSYYNRMHQQGLVPDLSEGVDRSSADFRRKAIGFLRGYDRAVPDRHQSQRCIKCFHCVSECPQRVFIVNELAALTALTDELRDWECLNL